MVSALISRVILLVFGTLYPAYRSYKAIKNKDVREYVKWMMYWIIFAFFTTGETFADMFLSWLPLYYEIKIVFILWLLSPATKGSSILYRKFVHPRLVKHEKAIDRYIARAQNRSYATLMDVGKKGFNVATDTLLKTAATGQIQLVQTLRKYNSMQDLTTDSTDYQAVESKRSTWYGSTSGPGSSGQNFDPDDDLDILQRQYGRTKSLQEDPYRKDVRQQRSGSDNMNLPTHEEEEDYPEDSGDGGPPDELDNEEDHLSMKMKTSSTTGSEQPINYAYSSNTLPRARKQRKPLYETMPTNASKTRTTRSSRGATTKLE